MDAHGHYGVQHLDGTPPKPVGYPNGHLNHILVTRSGGTTCMVA